MEDNLHTLNKNIEIIDQKILQIEGKLSDTVVINESLDDLASMMNEILKYQQKRRSKRKEHHAPSDTYDLDERKQADSKK